MMTSVCAENPRFFCLEASLQPNKGISVPRYDYLNDLQCSSPISPCVSSVKQFTYGPIFTTYDNH
jgi:hypothetical protein